jgi:hypothetical protein
MYWMYDHHDDTWLLLEGREIVFGIGGVSVRSFKGTDQELADSLFALRG